MTAMTLFKHTPFESVVKTPKGVLLDFLQGDEERLYIAKGDTLARVLVYRNITLKKSDRSIQIFDNGEYRAATLTDEDSPEEIADRVLKVLEDMGYNYAKQYASINQSICDAYFAGNYDRALENFIELPNRFDMRFTHPDKILDLLNKLCVLTPKAKTLIKAEIKLLMATQHPLNHLYTFTPVLLKHKPLQVHLVKKFSEGNDKVVQLTSYTPSMTVVDYFYQHLFEDDFIVEVKRRPTDRKFNFAVFEEPGLIEIHDKT